MKKTVLGSHLYNCYKRAVRAFQSHLNKSEHSSNVKSIHQLRVDIKKIRAFLRLFQFLFPDKFKLTEYNFIFNPVFTSAGRIREAQVNINCLSHYKLPLLTIRHYHKFVYKNEEHDKKKLKKAIRSFDISRLIHSQSKIKKLCSQVNTEYFNEKYLLFKES